MDLASPEPPEPIYRGLAFCDLCGAPLVPREQLAGLCARCKVTFASTVKPATFRPKN